MTDLHGKMIAVLMGGKSGEREVSLRSGQGVIDALTQCGHTAVGVDPNCHLAEQLDQVGAEIVFNALHGGAGEDGTIAGMLEVMSIPYTGCGVLASALTLDKIRTKQLLRSVGIPVPNDVWSDDPTQAASVADEALAAVGLPCVVKPIFEGSSLGVTIPKTEDDVRRDVACCLEQFGDVMVEEFCGGMEITVGVLGARSGLLALPVLELVPKVEFYDYEAKYTKGLTDLICPARMPDEAAAEARDIAMRAHTACACHGLSRTDMHFDEGRFMVHEINSVPGLTETSDVPAQARAAGMSYPELIEEILKSALTR